MSLLRGRVRPAARGFPRVSGDEPPSVWLGLKSRAFSPRERG